MVRSSMIPLLTVILPLISVLLVVPVGSPDSGTIYLRVNGTLACAIHGVPAGSNITDSLLLVSEDIWSAGSIDEALARVRAHAYSRYGDIWVTCRQVDTGSGVVGDASILVAYNGENYPLGWALYMIAASLLLFNLAYNRIRTVLWYKITAVYYTLTAILLFMTLYLWWRALFTLIDSVRVLAVVILVTPLVVILFFTIRSLIYISRYIASTSSNRVLRYVLKRERLDYLAVLASIVLAAPPILESVRTSLNVFAERTLPEYSVDSLVVSLVLAVALIVPITILQLSDLMSMNIITRYLLGVNAGLWSITVYMYSRLYFGSGLEAALLPIAVSILFAWTILLRRCSDVLVECVQGYRRARYL